MRGVHVCVCVLVVCVCVCAQSVVFVLVCLRVLLGACVRSCEHVLFVSSKQTALRMSSFLQARACLFKVESRGSQSRRALRARCAGRHSLQRCGLQTRRWTPVVSSDWPACLRRVGKRGDAERGRRAL